MGFPIVGSLISAAGNLLGGWMDNEATEDANNANIQNSRFLAAHNARQAQLNRAFQHREATRQITFQRRMFERANDYATRMSNTAVTRRMEDLKNAGINPILAGKYDASSPTAVAPSGAAAHGSQSAGTTFKDVQPVNGFANSARTIVSDILDMQRQVLEVENTEKTGKLIDAQTHSAMQDVPLKGAQTSESAARTHQARTGSDKQVQEIENLKADVRRIEEMTYREHATARNIEQDTVLKSKDVPKSEMVNDLLTRVQSVVNKLFGAYDGAVNHSAKSLKESREKYQGFLNQPSHYKDLKWDGK